MTCVLQSPVRGGQRFVQQDGQGERKPGVGHQVSGRVCDLVPSCRPDMTYAVDWALNANDLSSSFLILFWIGFLLVCMLVWWI